MPFSKLVTCTILDNRQVTRELWRISFESSRRFTFEAGQFLSVRLPVGAFRIYSLASTPEEAASGRYELCVQLRPGGAGSGYMTALKPGDRFAARAPFGDFVYETDPGRAACFISTGSGIAPLRSIALSRAFREEPPARATFLFGARHEADVPYPDVFDARHLAATIALSRPSRFWTGYTGRVTDYLQSLPHAWGWRETDFYVCGSAAMIRDVQGVLRARGVADAAIRAELFDARAPQLAREAS